MWSIILDLTFFCPFQMHNGFENIRKSCTSFHITQWTFCSLLLFIPKEKVGNTCKIQSDSIEMPMPSQKFNWWVPNSMNWNKLYWIKEAICCKHSWKTKTNCYFMCHKLIFLFAELLFFLSTKSNFYEF